VQVKVRNFFLAWIIVGALIFSIGIGCAPKATVPTIGGQVQVQTTPKALAYKTISAAFSAYDLGMTTLRTLQQKGVITAAQYEKVKNDVGWPFYNAIKSADTAVEGWVKIDDASSYGKAFAALDDLTGAQKDFTATIASVQKGGK